MVGTSSWGRFATFFYGRVESNPCFASLVGVSHKDFKRGKSGSGHTIGSRTVGRCGELSQGRGGMLVVAEAGVVVREGR